MNPPDELLLGFTRALRAAGVAVTPDRAQSYLRAVALVGADDRTATYWAGQATLCSGPDDLHRYAQVFDSWFLSQETTTTVRERPDRTVVQAELGEDPEGLGNPSAAGDETVHAMASATEVLRHRDIAEMDRAEKARLAALFSALGPRSPLRTANRRKASRRGELDAHRTLRRTLSRMGEPGELAWHRKGVRDRRVVLLVDVSGSMSAYADALLRLAHTFVHGSGPSGGARGGTPRVEVFTLGTRLTHVTTALRQQDPARAVMAAGETVPDWSGGTRLGETLKKFLDRWGQRGMARGSVVVVFSDGWERGKADLLGEQMKRLHRLAHYVVWVNPHRGKEGYQPVQQGIVAALPHVDAFLAGHSMSTFAELIEVVADA
ncbi:MAG: VWA domain-containing protein [Actinomycetota bacterium]|nr:VWA domain-containing protein [Actinomycetota bacterium]